MIEPIFTPAATQVALVVPSAMPVTVDNSPRTEFTQPNFFLIALLGGAVVLFLVIAVGAVVLLKKRK
jgi:hypothetical protein